MSFIQIKNFFSWGLLIIITLLFLYLVHGFFAPVFWAMVLGIVFYPVYEKILHISKNKSSLSSAVTILLILLFIFTPLYFVAKAVAVEAKSFHSTFVAQENQISGYIEIIDLKLQGVGIKIDGVEGKIIDGLKTAFSSLKDEATAIGKSTLNGIVSFFFMLYLLFFVFKDGKKFAVTLSDILPLGNKKEAVLFARFISIVRVIFKGTLLVALAQGVLGGLLFYIVGVKAIFLWTIVMVIFAVIPAVGPAFILVPTGIFFIMGGDVVQAMVLFVGAGVISVLDNILRPLLVGRDLKLHDALITISIFGGLSIFGIAGLIVGPIVAGMFVLIWEFFREEFRTELTND